MKLCLFFVPLFLNVFILSYLHVYRLSLLQAGFLLPSFCFQHNQEVKGKVWFWWASHRTSASISTFELFLAIAHLFFILIPSFDRHPFMREKWVKSVHQVGSRV